MRRAERGDGATVSEADSVDLRRRSSACKASVSSASSGSGTVAGLDVNAVLTSISDMLKDKQLRVSDLFRNPHYNPSYLINHDEELDAAEVASVLAKAGLQLSLNECKMLIRVLDEEGRGVLQIPVMEIAIRKFRRGFREWEIKTKTEKKSRLNWKRAAATNSEMLASIEESGGESPDKEHLGGMKAMSAISALLDEKHLRLQDLFRHPAYNPAVLEGGWDETMTAKAIFVVLKKVGLVLPFSDVKLMLECLDEDGSGSLDLLELEAALRNHRRGNIDWKNLADEAVKNRKEKKVVNMDYLHSLSDRHQAKLTNLRQRRELLDQEEDEKIEESKAKNRLGTRAQLTQQDFDPWESSERLYHEHVDLELRRQALQQNYEAEERRRIDGERAKFRRRRSASVPDLSGEADQKSIGERLHGYREAKDKDLRAMRLKLEVHMLEQTDTIGQKAYARGIRAADRHLQLYDEAEHRRGRRETQMKKNLEEQSAHWAEKHIGHGREALTPEKMTRIHELYEESTIREQRKKELALNRFKQEMDEIQKAAARARENTVKQLETVKGKLRDAAPFKSPEQSLVGEDSPRRRLVGAAGATGAASAPPSPSRPLGFGTATPRKWLLGDEAKSSWCIESVDHALSTINHMVGLRTNCVPNNEQLEALRDLVEPLKEAMQEFRDATAESELQGQGVTAMRTASSRRLFAEGNLLEDPVGWHECVEPDPLKQVEEDFDKLLEIAERAQAALLTAVGPEDNLDGQKIRLRWPVGAKWNHPRATKKAHFAVNAGAKPKDNAWVKAFVRYGPSERENRYRHLTDLARCGLVFVDAAMLKAGLEQIIERFEVIDVRNFYHPSCQNLLGEKYVEVLVVVKVPEPFICEIRLEEMSYMIARERCRPHIDQIATAFADIYHGGGAHYEAIKYLVRWVLHKPRECHAVTVFKKHLARRFGSTVVAWRKALGNGQKVSFFKFREACQDIGQRHRTVEFWQSLDATRAGCVSLFDLDTEATVLLIKFYWRILGLATPEQLADPKALFSRLTSKSVVKPSNGGRLEAHEFRRAMKPLGFSHLEADRMFVFLDSHGGDLFVPPATVNPIDLGWLQRLPKLVDMDAAMLKDEKVHSEMESLRALTYAGRTQAMEGRRARIPALARSSSASSVGRVSAIPRASLFARRSISASPSQNSLFALEPRSARASFVQQPGSTGGLSPPMSARSAISGVSSGSSKAFGATAETLAAAAEFRNETSPEAARLKLVINSGGPGASGAGTGTAPGAVASAAGGAGGAAGRGSAIVRAQSSSGGAAARKPRAKGLARSASRVRVGASAPGSAPSSPQKALAGSGGPKDSTRLDSARSTQQPDSQRSKSSSDEGLFAGSGGSGDRLDGEVEPGLQGLPLTLDDTF